MRSIAKCIIDLLTLTMAHNAWGHGFDLSVNYDGSGNPVSFTAASAQPVLDQDGPTPGPANLFLDAFAQTPNPDGSLGTYEGFTQTAGPWLPYTASFNIISPLYFSDGTGGPATPATDGTYLHIYDRYAGNPDPVTDPHPAHRLATSTSTAARRSIPDLVCRCMIFTSWKRISIWLRARPRRTASTGLPLT